MPAVRVPGSRSIRWRLGGAGEGPFLGGLNLRDEFTEVQPNELVDGTNFTLDERGVAIKRNDCPVTASLGAASTPPGTVTAFFFSSALNVFICQVGTTLYKAALGAAAWTSFKVMTTSEICAFVDFGGELVFCHGTDGIWTYDGAAATQREAGIGQVMLAVWQNKVYSCAGPSAPKPYHLRVHWCAIGNSHSWTVSTDFVDIREKDDDAVTALFGGSGLLVFKENSTYRVNDSTTGSYQTIDWNTGCIGQFAVCGSDDGIFVWGRDGLYQGNGLGQFVLVGDKLRPRFTSANINTTTKPLIAGAYLNGRVYFAFPRTSSTIPDAVMEYNPRAGWLMEAYLTARVGPFARYLDAAGIARVSFASAAATIKDLFTGTTRTGFSCSLTSAYQQIFGGYIGRVFRIGVGVHIPGTTAPVVSLNYIDGGNNAQVAEGPLTPDNTILAAGAQQLPFTPGARGKAFQLAVNDTASPLNSLSVFDAQMDALLTALR